MTARKTLLLLCSGLGLGNSSRLLGVVQAIRSRFKVAANALRVVVGTSGRAADFWNDEAAALDVEVLGLASYPLRPAAEGSRIRWASLARPASARTYWHNTRRIFSFLARDGADLAVIDSDYHCLPLLYFRVPIVALGQAWDVLRRFERGGPGSPIPRSSMIIERLDLLFQRLVSRVILAPTFGRVGPVSARVEAVPLIVRREFTAAASRRSGRGVVMLLSGSGIGARPLLAYARRHGVPVIGGGPGISPALDPLGNPRIDEYSVVIAQAGLSSISECLARGKRMALLPMDGHGEQLANALEVERQGQGILLSELVAPSRLLARLERVRGAPSSATPRPRTDGAEFVAERLLQALELAR